MLKDIYENITVYARENSDLHKAIQKLIKDNLMVVGGSYWIPGIVKYEFKNVFYGTVWKIENLMRTERN